MKGGSMVKNEHETRPDRQSSQPGLAAKVTPMANKENPNKKPERKTNKQHKPSSSKPIIL